MKKVFLFVVVVAMSIAASATDLWTGSKHVSWSDGGIDIEAAKFADAAAGQKIVVTFTDATDGIEFKLLDVWNHVPGSRKMAWINGDGTFELFLTEAAVAGLKEHGMQAIGANFTCTKVELLDGKQLKDGLTLWTGFHWANGWDDNLILYSDACAGVDWSKYSALRVYHEAGRDNFEVNLKRNWDAAGFIVGTDGNFAESMTITDAPDHSYKEFALTEASRAAAVVESDEFIMQCYKGDDQDAFNVTDIVLVLKLDDPTAVNTAIVDSKAVKMIVNGQVVIIKNGIRYNVLGAQL